MRIHIVLLTALALMPLSCLPPSPLSGIYDVFESIDHGPPADDLAVYKLYEAGGFRFAFERYGESPRVLRRLG